MEGKQRKNSDKIEPFPIFSEITESEDNMDEALRRQLMIEADEYEKILNSDQNLDYIDEIEEPPELFAAIIQKLKDEKKWIDEEETEPAKAEEILETVVGEEKKVNYAQGEGNREQIYNLLSDEDKKALAIGKRKLAQRKRDKVLKFAGAAAMVCLCLFGVSMTSSANREYVMALWNTLTAQSLNIGIENSNNYVESSSKEENSIYNEIQDKTGITPLKFLYKPEGMKYSSCNIDSYTNNAIIQYLYDKNDTVINLFMYKKSLDASGYQSFDGKYTDSFQITIATDKIITISEIENPNGEKEYVTQFENSHNYYSVSAIMDKKEFTKLLQNAYF